MIFPDTFEHKIGFDRVRHDVRELCISSLGEKLLDDMHFSADYGIISRWLAQVHEMAGLIAAGDDMPLDDVRDVTRQVESLRVPGTWLPAAELLSVGRSLGAVGDIAEFMDRHRDEDGASHSGIAGGYGVFDAVASVCCRYPPYNGPLWQYP